MGRMMATDNTKPRCANCGGINMTYVGGNNFTHGGWQCDKCGRMDYDTDDYIIFDRTGTPHVVVAVKAEIGGNCQQSENRETEREEAQHDGV